MSENTDAVVKLQNENMEIFKQVQAENSKLREENKSLLNRLVSSDEHYHEVNEWNVRMREEFSLLKDQIDEERPQSCNCTNGQYEQGGCNCGYSVCEKAIQKIDAILGGK